MKHVFLRNSSSLAFLLSGLAFFSGCGIEATDATPKDYQMFRTEIPLDNGSNVVLWKELHIPSGAKVVEIGSSYTQDLTYFLNRCSVVVDVVSTHERFLDRNSSFEISAVAFTDVDDQISDDLGNPIRNWHTDITVQSAEHIDAPLFDMKCEFYVSHDETIDDLKLFASKLIEGYFEVVSRF